MKQKAEKFLNTALGGNMNLATLKPLALIEIMTAFAEIEVAAINYTRCCDKLPKSDIILARYLHDSYELIAKKQDWNTQENCKVDFSDLPIENKNTMIFLAGKIIQDFGGN
jgi:hypothetical protein|tara:strand:+ start:336 stop:668 length:333 start_codon:yes stop_codon:yes gene_type:complete